MPPPLRPRIATLVLCTPGGDVLGQLPPFRTEQPWWQDASDLVRGARENHGLEVKVLRLLEAELPGPPGGSVTYLAEVADEPVVGTLAPWHRVLDEHPLRLPYAEPGGPDRGLAWAAAALEKHGFQPTGRAEQVRTWNLSSLWRIPTDTGTAWLKCVPPFFAHEGAMVSLLRGGPVPSLLAHEPGRVLMREIPGEDQHGAGLPTLLALVSLLVDLQARWVARDGELLGLGLPDWRAVSLSDAIGSLVRRTAERLPDDDLRTLNRLVAGLADRFALLDACGIPDSLVHGDFWAGNARGYDDRLVLMDWGDSGVGHPLLDRSAFLDRIPSDVVPQVREHWDRAWREVVPGCDPRRAAALLAPVAAARQAVVYQGFLDRIEPSEHPYHRDDPSLWLRRAAGLARQETS